MIEEKEYEDDITIDDSSAWHLNRCLKNHSKIEGKYSRLLADAIKDLDDLTYRLEISTAEIAEEIFNRLEAEGKPVPASGKDAIMKGEVRLDKRYQDLRKQVIEAKYVVAVLKGYMKGISGRGYRLKEICKLEENRMRGGQAYNGGDSTDQKSEYDKYKSVDKKIDDAMEHLEFGKE